MTNSIPKAVNAFPTKDLFISTLVRDIPLDRAILDLIDNSVDGAKRLRGEERLNGLWIEVVANGEQFSIKDNCGGFSLDLAVNYAFRFGRPTGMEQTPHSVGQFGVGMKRALFKLGRQFSVDSVAAKSRFRMSLEVEKWKNQTDENGNEDWTFPLVAGDYLNEEVPVADRGTTIVVDQLLSSVQEEFKLANFLSRLEISIGMTQEVSLEKGLVIKVNGNAVRSHPPLLASSRVIRPAFVRLSVNGGGPAVKVKIYAGVTKEDRTPLSEAGWYVFCNERLVVAADQTQVTGWEEDTRFHPTFNRFRGYVFFDCDDASRLPWNTMKSGVDVNSPVYVGVRVEMASSMKLVLNFLRNLADEVAEGDADQTLHSALDNAGMVKLATIAESKQFKAPDLKWRPKKLPRVQWLRFQKPRAEVDRAKEVLGVKSVADAGSKAFDYFYDHECGE